MRNRREEWRVREEERMRGEREDERGERVALRKSVEGEEFASTWADFALTQKL